MGAAHRVFHCRDIAILKWSEEYLLKKCLQPNKKRLSFLSTICSSIFLFTYMPNRLLNGLYRAELVWFANQLAHYARQCRGVAGHVLLCRVGVSFFENDTRTTYIFNSRGMSHRHIVDYVESNCGMGVRIFKSWEVGRPQLRYLKTAKLRM